MKFVKKTWAKAKAWVKQTVAVVMTALAAAAAAVIGFGRDALDMLMFWS